MPQRRSEFANSPSTGRAGIESLLHEVASPFLNVKTRLLQQVAIDETSKTSVPTRSWSNST
jgi:hypothetical protein